MIPLRDGLWASGVEVADVGDRRHRVRFPEDDAPSGLSYCNECGHWLILEGGIRASGVEYRFDMCSGCHAFMGWCGDVPPAGVVVEIKGADGGVVRMLWPEG